MFDSWWDYKNPLNIRGFLISGNISINISDNHFIYVIFYSFLFILQNSDKLNP